MTTAVGNDGGDDDGRTTGAGRLDYRDPTRQTVSPCVAVRR